MNEHRALLSRPRMAKGCSIQIYGEAQTGDTLAVEGQNNYRLSGELVSLSPSTITVLIDGRMYALDAWAQADDPLPLANKPFSRWTAR